MPARGAPVPRANTADPTAAADDECRCETESERTIERNFSVAPAAGGGWTSWMTALARLFADLAPLPTHCIVITQDPNQRYVQLMAGHRHMRLEASSNHYLQGDFRLSPREESHLERLGFRRPDHPDAVDRFPANWWIERGAAPTAVADLLVHVMAAVMGFDDRFPVHVAVFGAASPCRACSWSDEP